MKPVRVLIIDDSAFMREILSTLLSSDEQIEVVGTAADPYVAREKIKALNPDVLTLDVEMPRMDGLAFLRKVMALRPMPVVMISSLTQEGAGVTLEALEVGAVDFVPKPDQDVRRGIEDSADTIIAKVKAAAAAAPKIAQGAKLAKPAVRAAIRSPLSASRYVIVMGSSTGGVEALRCVLTELPSNIPPILIVQHMPERFTHSFAERLNGVCAITVKELSSNQRIIPGHAYIAPGNRHLELACSGAEFQGRLKDGPPVSGHKPSVDVLFHSAASAIGKNAIGAILTGMGKDGAEGMLALRQAGAQTLGQDEATSLVYGMPRAAFEAGGVMKQVALKNMARELIACCNTSQTAKVS